ISTETPSKYSLSQNYPNPFNPTTNIKFSIINSGDVKLVVYDIQGREVQTLVNERLNAGTYEVKFDGSMLTSGVYFYKMVSEGFTETKRMILIK
ncbi:MAG: T9SS type A sorting domain-containing protein, partial [Ignavibacteriota bacterium]